MWRKCVVGRELWGEGDRDGWKEKIYGWETGGKSGNRRNRDTNFYERHKMGTGIPTLLNNTLKMKVKEHTNSTTK